MTINSIRLDPGMVASLYPDSLIQEQNPNHHVPAPVSVLGNNLKKIMVVVSHGDVSFLPDTELSFLTNILAACKLGMADIAIVNKDRINAEELMNFLKDEARTVLLFNSDPLSIGLPINFPFFQVQSFDKRTYLSAPSLSEIESDKSLKQKLWTSLKNIFSIS